MLVYPSVNWGFVNFETLTVGKINTCSCRCLESVRILLVCVRQHISVVSAANYTQGVLQSLRLLVTRQPASSKGGELNWNDNAKEKLGDKR